MLNPIEVRQKDTIYCRYCGYDLHYPTREHLVPRWLCRDAYLGDNPEDDIVPCCRYCNHAKGSYVEFPCWYNYERFMYFKDEEFGRYIAWLYIVSTKLFFRVNKPTKVWLQRFCEQYEWVCNVMKNNQQKLTYVSIACNFRLYQLKYYIWMERHHIQMEDLLWR